MLCWQSSVTGDADSDSPGVGGGAQRCECFLGLAGVADCETAPGGAERSGGEMLLVGVSQDLGVYSEHP